MVILKKVKGSTLMETLVATVLIIVIFMIASMILNSLFSNTIKSNTRVVEAHLSELRYLQIHDQIKIPYQDTMEEWTISIEPYQESTHAMLEFKAIHVNDNREITKTYHEAH